MKTRIETDSLGQVEIPQEKYWGAQTQRSLTNFKIGNTLMPKEIIQMLAIVKSCQPPLKSKKRDRIAQVCNK